MLEPLHLLCPFNRNPLSILRSFPAGLHDTPQLHWHGLEKSHAVEIPGTADPNGSKSGIDYGFYDTFAEDTYV